MADLIPAPRPVPTHADRIADRIADARSFRTWMSDTDRDQLDARAATAEQERDDALDDLREARAEIAQWKATYGETALRDALAHHTDLHNRIAGLENDLRSANRAVLELTAERDDYARRLKATDASWARLAAELDQARAELGAAQELIAVVRDAGERIDRALAAYDTQPTEPADAEPQPEQHEDPARLRQQLAEAHADCARYATERDRARKMAEDLNAETMVLNDTIRSQAAELAALGSPSPRAQDEPDLAPVIAHQFSVRYPDGFVDGGRFTEGGARQRAAELGGEVVYRAVGPWQPAGREG